MNKPCSVIELIDLWPSVAAFARDAGVGYEAAKQMRRRGSIAVEHWPAIIASGRGQEITLASDDMMRIHAVRRGIASSSAPRLESPEAAE